jgi:hypothetical protein
MKQSKLKTASGIVESSFVHLFEPEQKIQNFKFIHFNDFTKKRNKKQKYNLYVGDLLEYFDKSDSLEVIKSIVEKLESGSQLHIQGVDAKSVAQSFASDELTETMYSVLMYGLGKKNIFTFPSIKNLIKHIDHLEIVNIRFMNAINYYLECSVL